MQRPRSPVQPMPRQLRPGIALGIAWALAGSPAWAIPTAAIPGPCYAVDTQGQVINLAHICNPNIAADRAQQQAWDTQVAAAAARGDPLVCQLDLGRVTTTTAQIQGRCLGLQATENLALTVVLAGPTGSLGTQQHPFATVHPGQTYPVQLTFQDYALPPAATLGLSHRLEQHVGPAPAEAPPPPPAEVPW